jgi:hypothetical protein
MNKKVAEQDKGTLAERMRQICGLKDPDQSEPDANLPRASAASAQGPVQHLPKGALAMRMRQMLGTR